MNEILQFLAKIITVPLITVLTFAGYPIIAPVPQVYPSQDYQENVRGLVDSYVKQSIKDTQNDIVLGAAPDYFAATTFVLAGAGVSSSATSITLSSLTITQSGQKIVTADLIAGVGNKFYLTLEPGNRTKQEVISCTVVTQNANGTATLTGCSRGLAPITPYTASTTLQFVHGGGSQAIFSNPPQVYRDIIAYIDAASIAGAVDGSLTAKGIFEKATGAEAAENKQVGTGNTTAPLVLTTDIASSTRTANTAQVVVSSSTTGYIDNSYIATSTLASILTPVGSITAYASTTAPAGWLLVDGTAVSRTTYSALFAVIGTSYGVGDGSTTFTLPDIRGRNILMASTTANMGQKSGESLHTMTVAELATHTHGVGRGGGGSPTTVSTTNNSDGGTPNQLTTSSTGSATPFNVLDPYIVLHYIIKF